MKKGLIIGSMILIFLGMVIPFEIKIWDIIPKPILSYTKAPDNALAALIVVLSSMQLSIYFIRYYVVHINDCSDTWISLPVLFITLGFNLLVSLGIVNLICMHIGFIFLGLLYLLYLGIIGAVGTSENQPYSGFAITFIGIKTIESYSEYNSSIDYKKKLIKNLIN